MNQQQNIKVFYYDLKGNRVAGPEKAYKAEVHHLNSSGQGISKIDYFSVLPKKESDKPISI